MSLPLLELLLLSLPLVLGAYLSFSLMKLPDLSIESAYLFGAVAAISMQDLPLPEGGLGILILIGASLLGGALVGVVSSALNQLFRLPYLLAAIITNGLFHGLTQFTLGQPLLSFRLSMDGGSELSFLLLVGVVLCLILLIVLRSQLGVSFAIYGNNPQFFTSHGISTRFVVMAGVCLADACAGLGGYLFAQSNGFVDLSMGYGVVLFCLTSLMLGKVVIPTAKPSLATPLVGVIFALVIQQLLLNLGLDLKYFNAFQALFLVVALLILNRKKQFSIQQLTDHLGV